MNDGRAHLGRPRFTFNRFHRERVLLYRKAGIRHARLIHSINYDRSGIIRRLIPIGSPSARDGGDSTAIAASIHPVVSRDTFRGAGTIRVTDRN